MREQIEKRQVEIVKIVVSIKYLSTSSSTVARTASAVYDLRLEWTHRSYMTADPYNVQKTYPDLRRLLRFTILNVHCISKYFIKFSIKMSNIMNFYNNLVL